ncbi:hemolysin and related protein containing CBS domains [Gracilibacillus boraciitolerans JCM 21714]|uniref:Hemolysin and related protein containing CBS domains n=1 Tax=Gracilibacillus boraciitolerans JCM 21714 TaxID=1298598 RepID=W4VKS2_9BACI|nr:hemolysin family protein [Gracilibacillus boraciitolerans]GAE93408.1 hemolysin and related protein containing CBS domains [Gracilibacillus boraciitolerans JCM 21714]
MLLEIFILIVLILINAFFAASEISLVALNDNKIKKRAEQKDQKSMKLQKLLAEPGGRFLATIQIGITLAGFLASAFAADSFAAPLANWLVNIGVPVSMSLLETIAVIIITILLSYFTLVIGELVPKQLALQKAERIAYKTVNPLLFLFKLSYPFVKILNLSTNFIVKLFGVDPNAKQEEVNEEEIRMLVDIGGERGTIESDEKRMIHNIFEFNDKSVSDIMTHRTDITAINMEATIDEVLEVINEKRFTHFPVYEGDIDHIIGILHMKDIFPILQKYDREFALQTVLRKPYYVMDSQLIDVAFRDMKKHNIHIAMVVDEYGGIDGLITMEDVIEEIVGEILSEHHLPGGEDESSSFKKVNNNQYEVEGTTHLYLLEEAFQVELPSEEFETLNGFMVHQLGYIPHSSERPKLAYKDLVFEATKISAYRIEKVLITIERDQGGDET